MKTDIYSYTNKGTREHNEDYFEVYRSEQQLTAVLCDGLGGHNCGEVASKAAAENLVEGIKQMSEITEEGISSVLKVVNDGLVQYQTDNPEFAGMRTTAVGCNIVPESGMLYYFNVGDSRFYLFKNGILKYMSKDHSVSQLSVEMGQMTFNDIRFDADRSKLLKVLGEKNSARQIGAVYPPVKIENGDAFLLCSDGFWEYVLEEEMEADLAKSHTAEEWIKYMLVRLLLKRRSENDNYTVVGGIIESEAKTSPETVQDDLHEWTDDTSLNENRTALPQTTIKEESTAPTAPQFMPPSPMPAARPFMPSKSKLDELYPVGAELSPAVGRKRRKKEKSIVLRIKLTKANIIIFVCIAVAIIIAIVALLSAEFINPDKKNDNVGMQANVQMVDERIMIVDGETTIDWEGERPYTENGKLYFPWRTFSAQVGYVCEETENGGWTFESGDGNQKITLLGQDIFVEADGKSRRLKEKAIVRNDITYVTETFLDEIGWHCSHDNGILNITQNITHETTKEYDGE